MSEFLFDMDPKPKKLNKPRQQAPAQPPAEDDPTVPYEETSDRWEAQTFGYHECLAEIAKLQKDHPDRSFKISLQDQSHQDLNSVFVIMTQLSPLRIISALKP